MEFVRQRLNPRRDLECLPPQYAHTTTDFRRQMVLELFQFVGQQGEPLTSVVVKLSCDPHPFLLLCLNQLAVHTQQRGLREFAVRDIDPDSDVSSKRALRVESWHPDVQNPPILSVVSPQPILHSEALTLVKRLAVGLKAVLHVLAVNPLRPAV